MTMGDSNSSLACIHRYEEHYVNKTNQIYCNATWDGYLCWPPTLPGTNATQRCPKENGFEPTQYTYRTCRVDGRWEGVNPNDTSKPNGYTHYESCLNEVLKRLYESLRRDGRHDVLQSKLTIAKNTRLLEFVGFSISLVSLLISLFIFCRYRSLRNNRTRIHKNLFVAMLIQVQIRLTLYIDQAIVKQGYFLMISGIDNTPFVCEAGYVLLEYARTAMFMWMFIEGLYLHNMLTVTVFQENAYHLLFSFIGWGVPVVMTTAWVVTMFMHYPKTCWISYNLTPYFWILEGPRLVVLVLNTLFLSNIIRILIVKLKQTHTSELEQVRTAVRATLFLLPLMGITNILVMTDSHVDGEVWEFALWSYITHFLTSFQGFFIALLYCFLNGEDLRIVPSQENFEESWNIQFILSGSDKKCNVDSESKLINIGCADSSEKQSKKRHVRQIPKLPSNNGSQKEIRIRDYAGNRSLTKSLTTSAERMDSIVLWKETETGTSRQITSGDKGLTSKDPARSQNRAS